MELCIAGDNLTRRVIDGEVDIALPAVIAIQVINFIVTQTEVTHTRSAILHSAHGHPEAAFMMDDFQISITPWTITVNGIPFV